MSEVPPGRRSTRIMPCATCGTFRQVRRGLNAPKDCRICHNLKQRKFLAAMLRHQGKAR